ncbi:ankyrin repeat-containing protein At5g02620-like [Macadamia integrifolia]|uniref:ankyrin repeat-containing protein At5g02620-like n=1 Tax=Macadamia integrifolia TaxID=60698 RepID=UPI001C4FCC09|nr:ankyrin repeat-containing protein At5g02620-like [Macadamia integrifolia]
MFTQSSSQTIVSVLSRLPSYSAMTESTSSVNPLKYGDVYKAAEKGKDQLDIFLEFYRERPTSPINDRGDTILHLLILNKNITTASELLKLPLLDGLTAKNSKGNTPLHEAAMVGNDALTIAELMVGKEKSLVSECNLKGETPLYLAAAYGQTKMFNFLRKTISHDHPGLKRNDGCTVLHAAVMGEFYGLALKVMDWYPDLALDCNGKSVTALHLLCESPSSFKSGTLYSEFNISKAPFIPWALFKLVIYFCMPLDAVEDPEETENGQSSSSSAGNRKQTAGMGRRLVNSFSWIRLLRGIDDEKQKHNLARVLAKRLIIREPVYHSVPYISSTTNAISDTLMLAARYGIVEVIDMIFTEYQRSIEFLDKDGKNILHITAEYRQEGIFKILKSRGLLTTKIVTDVDKHKNTPLHLAADYAEHVQEKIFGPPAQKMWREMLWFKQVKDVSLSHLFHLRNDKDKTADELFDSSHWHLLEESVKKNKEVTESVILISTLIATINFTASFAVPGGYDQESGIPVFFRIRGDFPPFYAYSSIALFFSVIAISGCISSYLSRFHKNDFYLILPLKYLFNGNSLLFSVTYTVLAFSQAILLVTKDKFTPIEFSLAVTTIMVVLGVVLFIYIDIMFLPFCYLIDVLSEFIFNQEKMMY